MDSKPKDKRILRPNRRSKHLANKAEASSPKIPAEKQATSASKTKPPKEEPSKQEVKSPKEGKIIVLKRHSTEEVGHSNTPSEEGKPVKKKIKPIVWP